MRHAAPGAACALLLLGMAMPLKAERLMPGNTPTATVRTWYAWAMAGTQEPLSDAGLADAKALMVPPLFTAVQAQRAHERACARQVPDAASRPLQSPFFARPGAVDQLRSVAATAMGTEARVGVTLSRGAHHWTDVVVLRQHDGRWYVVDIRWAEGGSLRARLADSVSQSCGA